MNIPGNVEVWFSQATQAQQFFFHQENGVNADTKAQAQEQAQGSKCFLFLTLCLRLCLRLRRNKCTRMLTTRGCV